MNETFARFLSILQSKPDFVRVSYPAYLGAQNLLGQIDDMLKSSAKIWLLLATLIVIFAVIIICVAPPKALAEWIYVHISGH